MKILIIGGSRFVGPIIISKLIKRGHEIMVFNRGRVKSNYDEKVKFIRGDRKEGFNIKDHFDVVIDTCSYKGTHIQKAIDKLSFDYYVNFGTAASYKKTELFPLTEDSPLGDWPVWGEYNRGKVECEQVLRKSGIKFSTIRPVYILGSNNYVDRENFIYSRIKNKTPLILPGNGQAPIQFVFAEDVANSIVYLAENKIEGEFNCCCDEVITLKGLVEEMGKIVGVEPVIKYNLDADGEKYDENEFPFANENFFCTNKKLKDSGIKFTNLIEGLKKDYENYYKKII